MISHSKCMKAGIRATKKWSMYVYGNRSTCVTKSYLHNSL